MKLAPFPAISTPTWRGNLACFVFYPVPALQTLSAIRRHVRELVRSQAYAELDRYYVDLEAQWRDADSDSHPYQEAARSGTLFDFSETPYADAAPFLQDWIAACPGAYHPQLIWGRYCFGRAADIRGYGWADSVTQDRWLGAAMAGENTVVALLASLQAHPQPVAAAVTLMELAAHFEEPAWLLALYRGDPAQPLAATGLDPELARAAAGHLAQYGLAPLQQAPTALPAILPPRDAHELEQGEDYWLHLILQWRPSCLEALLAYASYLTPRWGGSYEDINGLAAGPLAAGLTEAQRNAIRWVGVYDSLSDYPEAGETRAAESHRQQFEAWLKRDLRPQERGDALGRYANFHSFSLDDNARAHDLHVASVQAFTEPQYFRQVDGPFRSFAHLTLIHHKPDTTGAFKTALQRMMLMDELGTPLALAAAAHQFGLWDFAQDSARATQLLDRAAQLGCTQLDDSFNILAAAAMFWDGGQHEIGYFLTREFADRQVPDAASAMYDIHRGFRDNTPDSYLDPAVRDQWLQRAVDAGSPLAKYNLAWRKLFEDNLDFADRANVDSVRQLLEDAREEPRTEGYARLRIGVLLRDHGTAEEQREGVQYLRSLVEHEDDWTSARASAEIALAYMHGRGATKNRFAAIEWASHASKLLPDNEGIDEIEAQVLNSHSLVKTVGTVFGAFLKRGGVTAEDLPPKSTQS